MESISITDAEGRLGELIDHTEIGDTITITRDGKPIAVVTRVEQPTAPRRPIDVDALKALTDRMTYHGTSAAELMREMRDSRY